MVEIIIAVLLLILIGSISCLADPEEFLVNLVSIVVTLVLLGLLVYGARQLGWIEALIHWLTSPP